MTAVCSGRAQGVRVLLPIHRGSETFTDKLDISPPPLSQLVASLPKLAPTRRTPTNQNGGPLFGIRRLHLLISRKATKKPLLTVV